MIDCKKYLLNIEKAIFLVVRAFACRRTNRGDNTVGSAVWRLARTADGNQLVVTDSLRNAVASNKEVVVYCGSGVTASPLYTVLKEAGYENVKLYVGSYSDWITKYEVATGEE